MSFVRTMLADIDPSELGFTYTHEHLVCKPPYWVEKGEADLLLDNPELTRLEVLDFKALGGESIVDATAVDYGRNVKAVYEIAISTGVNIIGTAGFNKGILWSARLPERIKEFVGSYDTYNHWIESASLDELVGYIVNEVTEGLEATSIKAGQIKFGTSYNSIKPLEVKTLRAAARAHLETNAPLTAHTEAGTMALEQIDLLKAEGIDLSSISFGHMDRNLDPFYHEEIAKTGAYLSFDGVGKVKYGPESDRIAAIIDLVRKGYEDQILISGDMARKSYYKHYDYGLGFEYIISKWIPRFLVEADRAGFDGEVLVDKFFRVNSARCLSFK